MYSQWVGSTTLAKSWLKKMSYVIGFLNQTRVLEFFTENGIWELSDEFWVLVMSFGDWVKKIWAMGKPNGP